jgi:hypothetical protein
VPGSFKENESPPIVGRSPISAFEGRAGLAKPLRSRRLRRSDARSLDFRSRRHASGRKVRRRMQPCQTAGKRVRERTQGGTFNPNASPTPRRPLAGMCYVLL